MELELLRDADGFKSYAAEGFRIYYGKKDGIAGNNSINSKEIIYLIAGKVEVTIERSVEEILAPAKIEIPAKTYHKIKALTDTSFLLFIL